MPDAICNTSPLLYLYRIGAIEWLAALFNEVWTPSAVLDELQEGANLGHDVPNPRTYIWLKIVDPRIMPSEWLALDLGRGELAAMALALENPQRIVILDDMLARRTAQAAGLTVWGTLKVLLEAKQAGLISSISPLLAQLAGSGMWISAEVRHRILILAKEDTGFRT